MIYCNCASTEIPFRLHSIRKSDLKLAVGLLSAVPHEVHQYGRECRNAQMLDTLSFEVKYYPPPPISRDDIQLLQLKHCS